MTALLEKVGFDFPLEVVKQTEEKGGFHIVGYAATTDFDLQGDIITPEALKAASQDLLTNSTVLLNHDIKRPIGKVTKAQFDKNGLLIDALISSTEPDIIQKIKEGVLNKFSIRGEVLERENKYIPELDRVANVINKLTLLEVSLVSVPANPEAKAIGWYLSKALQHSAQGGKSMQEEVIVEEISAEEIQGKKGQEPQPGAEASKAKAPAAAPPAQANAAGAAAVAEEPVEKAVASPLEALEKIIAMGGEAAKLAQLAKSLLKAPVTKSAAPVEPLRVSKADLGELVKAEVQKQVDAALKAAPVVRKGLVQQEEEADLVQKKFDRLTPEEKLKVALAMQEQKEVTR
jgi:HK97 family phage prohead protease